MHTLASFFIAFCKIETINKLMIDLAFKTLSQYILIYLFCERLISPDFLLNLHISALNLNFFDKLILFYSVHTFLQNIKTNCITY